jgi:hypothetical protein
MVWAVSLENTVDTIGGGDDWESCAVVSGPKGMCKMMWLYDPETRF